MLLNMLYATLMFIFSSPLGVEEICVAISNFSYAQFLDHDSFTVAINL